jgi:hypothetical protein
MGEEQGRRTETTRQEPRQKEPKEEDGRWFEIKTEVGETAVTAEETEEDCPNAT